MTSPAGKIDVHHHMVPEFYANEYGSALKRGSDRFGFFATISQTQPESVRELIGMDRLLFGSDFPFAPEMLVHVEVSELAALGLSEAESAAVGAGNARALLGA